MLGAYRPLFATAEARRLVAASLSARLAIGAFTLPLVLSVQEASGSFATAGVASGAFALGVAASAPLRGRLVDRRGSGAALPALVVVSSACLALVAALAGAVPSAMLVVLSAAAGVSTPPLVAAMRLEWQRLLGVGDPRLAQAYAFESSAQTAVFVVGPLLAAAGIALAGARMSLALSAAALVLGTLAFAAVASAPALGADGGGPSPIRRPGVLTLVLATALADFALGAIDVAVPAFAVDHGRPEVAGVLLAGFALSAVVGALVYGMRRWPLGPPGQLVAITAAGAVTVAALALPATPALLGAVLLVAGAPSAAQWAAASLALDEAGGGQAGAEAFTWLSAANGVGIALGSAAAGAVAETWGTSAAFALAAAGPAAAAVLLLARRRTLSARS